MSLRIKKGDLVVVLAGRHQDKGVRGRVLRVLPEKGTAIVEGVHIVKKHQKARSQTDQGGIIEREAPIPLCKLMLVESGGQGRAGRFATKVDAQGNKIRVLKLRGETKEITV
ncbi:MAG: 50S ribosomal protein L24 [bacterium]|nr:50S ribosomal protein L24 [bacterium]